MSAIGAEGEILVGISRRMIRGGDRKESLPRVPSFKAVDSRRGLDGLAVQMLLWWHRGGSCYLCTNFYVRISQALYQ